jgi:hypothetical protein
MPQLLPPRGPNLPLPPMEYNRHQQEQFSNALRLYFNQLDTAFQQLLLGFNHYGTFFDTTTQSPAVVNTAYPVTFNSAAEAFGVERGTDTSRIYVNRAGVYNFQISAQLDHVGGGAVDFYFWFRKNGTDIPNTAFKVVVAGPQAEIVFAANYLLTLRAGDYFQLVWSADSTDARLLAAAAAAPVPAIPSVILTVTYVYPNDAGL